MFVDYTWQCMKLPDQSSCELESQLKGVSQLPAVKNKKPSDGSDVIDDRNDVIVAAADSTTHGIKVMLYFIIAHTFIYHVQMKDLCL